MDQRRFYNLPITGGSKADWAGPYTGHAHGKGMLYVAIQRHMRQIGTAALVKGNLVWDAHPHTLGVVSRISYF